MLIQVMFNTLTLHYWYARLSMLCDGHVKNKSIKMSRSEWLSFDRMIVD